jgi:hypothetical protein
MIPTVYHIEGMPPTQTLSPSTPYMTRVVNAFLTATRDGETVVVMHLEFLGMKTEVCAFTVQVPQDKCIGTRK